METTTIKYNNDSHISNDKMRMTISKTRLLENTPIRPSAHRIWWSITFSIINERVEKRYMCKEAFDALMAQLTPAMTALKMPMASEQDFLRYVNHIPYHSNAWYYEYATYVAYYHNLPR